MAPSPRSQPIAKHLGSAAQPAPGESMQEVWSRSAAPTLTWLKLMVMDAADVKPFMTGQEMKSSRKPAQDEGQ